MRKPDAETYELGHWESMTIQRALTDFAATLENLEEEITTYDSLKVKHVKDLARIFAFGTHTVTRKVEQDG
jgi:uncharacterized protein YjaG (DUF416 family)